MASVNKAILIGNLGKDPETKSLPSGQVVGTLVIATSETMTVNGTKKEHTDWHNVVVWGKTAENCKKYLRKGSKVFVEGSIRHESYDKDGEKRFITKIRADQVTFLDSKQNDGNQAHKNQQVNPVAQQQNSEPFPQFDPLEIPF